MNMTMREKCDLAVRFVEGKNTARIHGKDYKYKAKTYTRYGIFPEICVTLTFNERVECSYEPVIIGGIEIGMSKYSTTTTKLNGDVEQVMEIDTGYKQIEAMADQEYLESILL